MLSQPRVLLAMARDGLVPPSFFGAVHERFRTPWKSTILTGVFVGLMAALVPLRILAELVNIGTLLAFAIVCAAVLIMRRAYPAAERPFRNPRSLVLGGEEVGHLDCNNDGRIDVRDVLAFVSAVRADRAMFNNPTRALPTPLSGATFPLSVRFPEGAGAVEQHRALGLIDQQARFSLPVHPVQLYEATLALALCIFLHRYFRKRRWHGQIFCLLILNYAAIRFGTEFLRADNPPIYFGLTLSQVISLVLGSAAMAIVSLRPRMKKTGLPTTAAQNAVETGSPTAISMGNPPY